MFPELVRQARKKSSSVCKFYHIVLSQRRCHDTNSPTKCTYKKGKPLELLQTTWESPAAQAVIIHEGNVLNSCEVRLDEKRPQVKIRDCTQPWHQLRTLRLVAAVGILANFQCADPKLLWGFEHPHLGCKKFCQGTTKHREKQSGAACLPEKQRKFLKCHLGVWKH